MPNNAIGTIKREYLIWKDRKKKFPCARFRNDWPCSSKVENKNTLCEDCCDKRKQAATYFKHRPSSNF